MAPHGGGAYAAHRQILTRLAELPMPRLLWVLVLGTALLVTSSASAQRGGGGKGKGKNRDGFPGMGRGDQSSDQPGFGRNRGGDPNDPSADPSGFEGGGAERPGLLRRTC